MVGELVVLTDSQTSGYKNEEIGLVVKTEQVGQLFTLYWIIMSDGVEVPFWDSEFEVLDESWRSDNSS